MKLEGTTAIVTGASSGLGAHLSRALITKGVTVFGLARSVDKLNEIHRQLGDAFHPVEMDITEQEAVDAWIEETFEEASFPDILVNNAGLGIFGPVDKLDPDDWHKMINTNLNGVYYITRQVVPLMKAKKSSSHIINISSIAGLLGNENLSGYNATKFALRGFGEALFKELRYDNIKVSTLFPGSIATSFFERVDMETHENMMNADEVSEVIINLLQTSDNFLINEMTMRPLNPKKPES